MHAVLASLTEEHRIILRVVAALEQAIPHVERGEAAVPTLYETVHFFRGFVALCHEQKEELCLLPALDRRLGGEYPLWLASLRSAHQGVRQSISQFHTAIAAREGRRPDAPHSAAETLHSFCEGWRAHFREEEQELFELAELHLSRAELDHVGQECLELETAQQALYRQWLGMIDRLEAALHSGTSRRT